MSGLIWKNGKRLFACNPDFSRIVAATHRSTFADASGAADEVKQQPEKGT